MKIFYVFMLVISSIVFAEAQVGVNTNDPKVSLDVQAVAVDATTAEGIIAPRLTLAQLVLKDAKYLADQTGAIVYVTDIVGNNTPKTKEVTSIGYYFFDGTIWQAIGPDPASRFFYMPSVTLPTDSSDPSYNPSTKVYTIDLYKAYAEQFGLTNSGSSIKSASSTSLPTLPSNALEYFITYYDNNVFQGVTLSDAGVLTYKLPDEITISDKTFMNIIFKAK